MLYVIGRGVIMLASKESCTGCSACYSACEFGAISMGRDKYGFIYPEINESKCVKCGKCSKICPILNELSGNAATEYFFGWNLDEEIRIGSSSGGIMSAIAETYLSEGWTIFGAVWNEKEKKVCIECANDETYKRQRKSKYVEAEVGDAFKQVKEILKAGGQVIYVGTPCQVSGLKSYLNNRREGIIYIDFVCHGVPSSGLLSEHVKNLEKKYKGSITDLNFRGKRLGWMDYVMELTIDNKIKKFRHSSMDSYYTGFVKDYILRENCYSCKWRSGFAGDLTIGDFWGIDNYKREMNDDKGISLVCVNNKKGNEIFEKIKPKIFWEKIPDSYAQYIYTDVFKDKKQYQRRTEFFDKLNELGFEKAAAKSYMGNYLIDSVKYATKRILNILKIQYRR